MADDHDGSGHDKPEQPVASTSKLTAGSDPTRGDLGTSSVNIAHTRHQTQQTVYKAPFFASATQPEIIRANQKDLYYLAQLSEQVEDAARGLLGTRWFQSWASELGLASRLAYYGLTTLIGTQTLGEEYVDILQYDGRTHKIPTLLARASILATHVAAPYLLSRLYNRIRERSIRRRERHNSAARVSANPATVGYNILNAEEPLFADDNNLQPAASDGPAIPQSLPRAGMLSHLPLFANLSDIELPAYETLFNEHVQAMHLAIFYLFGRYYHIAKRVLGIRYLSLQPRPQSNQPGASRPPSYEVLGVLMAIQLSVRIVSQIIKRRRAKRDEAAAARKLQATPDEKSEQTTRKVATIDGRPVTDLTFDPEEDEPDDLDDQTNAENDDDVPQQRRCTLCLGARRTPSATECGHVFCYQCIVGWAREKPECPLCRQKVSLSKILPLYGL